MMLTVWYGMAWHGMAWNDCGMMGTGYLTGWLLMFCIDYFFLGLAGFEMGLL
jgi:hypothetical protein